TSLRAHAFPTMVVQYPGRITRSIAPLLPGRSSRIGSQRSRPELEEIMAVKFSAHTQQRNLSWPKLLEIWQQLDRDSRFDGLWLADHYMTGMGRPAETEGDCLDGWTALAALALATSRARIGILVTENTFRHP